MLRQTVLFRGPNAAGPQAGDTLWETNGTAPGTFQFAQISAGLNGGVFPSYITAYNGEVLFEGIDSSNKFGLWVTNGTAAGTFELTGISGANPNGIQPGYMQVYNGVVLFQGFTGTSGNHVPSLWETDGTVAGTTEIGGVANTGISGILTNQFLRDPPEFTVFNGKVLFSAADAANNQGLWVTNGTAAGTFELTPISGAFTVGSPGSDVMGSATGAKGPDLAVLGTKVIFKGTDTGDTPGSLWVTDGTAAGTTEIGGLNNSGITGSPAGFTGQFTSELAHGMQPTDIVTFGNKVIFAAFDNQLDDAGYYVPSMGLWVSDGTAGGTTEIGGIGSTGIANALHYTGGPPSNGGGIFDSGSQVPGPDFTVFGNKVLFIGTDSTYHVGLWVTDGTANGTTEIGGLGNTGISGFSGVVGTSDSSDFTVFNGQVLFEGVDTQGHTGLWATDGTAAGTHEVAANVTSDTYSPLGPDFTVVSLQYAPPQNFNGNNTSDVLYRNAATGDTGFYHINNGVNAGWSDIGASSTAYSVVATGDFNGNGTSDVLYRSATSGDTGFYAIVNGANTGWHDVGASSTAYSVVGVGDFNRDGTADILYRNNSSGDTGFYAIVNGVNTGWHDVGASSTAYTVVGVGDFNNDGTSDILYRNNTTGDTGFYAIINGVNTGWHDVGASSTAYTVAGVGDFNADSTSDILYRNNTTGDTGFYAIVNGVNTGWHDIGVSSTAYTVVGAGDYNGDNTSDVLYRNASTGDTGFYAIVNGVNTGWHDIGASSTSYGVIK